MGLGNGNNPLLVQLQHQNSKLQGEMSQLRAQFQDVVTSNMQWQSYDLQRDEHIKRLAAEKNDLEV